MYEQISSLQNPKVKLACDLRDKRSRDKTSLFLIEGYREVLRALASSVSLKTLFVCPEFFLGTNEHALIEKAKKQGTLILQTEEKVFSKLSYRDRPDGLVAVAEKMSYTLDDLEKRLAKVASPLLVIAESIEKPGNLGTILRTCDAAGAHGVIVVDRCTDIYNPNVVRASVGTLFTVPVVEAESRETLDWLRKNQIKVLAAMPQAEKILYDVAMDKGIAIAFGTEQLGLSALWQQQADLTVRIPMHGEADSLNVAQSCAILLYEAVRQRQ